MNLPSRIFCLTLLLTVNLVFCSPVITENHDHHTQVTSNSTKPHAEHFSLSKTTQNHAEHVTTSKSNQNHGDHVTQSTITVHKQGDEHAAHNLVTNQHSAHGLLMNNQSDHNEGHGEGHGSDAHGASAEHGSSEDHGEHHVPPPSFQLQPHLYTYKPDGFIMYSRSVGLKRILVGFNYTTQDYYDSYIIRIRFHGQDEFATNRTKLNRSESNELILNRFLDAQYIVCVTLFSSSGLPQYTPLSTSDMCMDIVEGEPAHIGGHHSTTGLLSPLLLAVAAVLLLIIIIGQNIKDIHLEKVKKRKELEKALEDKGESDIVKERSREMRKSATQIQFEKIIKAPEDPKWQAAAQMCQIVNNKSYEDLSNPNLIQYENRGYNDEYDIRRPSRMSRLNSQNITSLQTLRHVLDNKPWAQKYN